MPHSASLPSHRLPKLALWLGIAMLTGCGTMRERSATHQLLLSDAVDRAVAHIDFSPLAGKTVFLDTQYLGDPKSTTMIGTPYIVSSLRQQMVSKGCLLRDKADDADYVVEARVGALGMDGHDVNVGVPQNNFLNAAAVAIPGTAGLPAIPEISLGRQTEDSAAAKIAVFAYRREDRQHAWQSGMSVATSTASGKWFLGMGPFQNGDIYNRPLFAGGSLFGSSDQISDDVNLQVGHATVSPEALEAQEKAEEEVYRTAQIYDPALQRAVRQPRETPPSARMSRLPEERE